jgi:hypothetical protein
MKNLLILVLVFNCTFLFSQSVDQSFYGNFSSINFGTVTVRFENTCSKVTTLYIKQKNKQTIIKLNPNESTYEQLDLMTGYYITSEADLSKIGVSKYLNETILRKDSPQGTYLFFTNTNQNTWVKLNCPYQL